MKLTIMTTFIVLNISASFGSSVSCYTNKKDQGTIVLETSSDSKGNISGVTTFSPDNSEKLRFDDISFHLPNKNDLLLVATNPNGAVVSLSVDIDRKGSDHTGKLILRKSDKTLEEISVECDLNN